MTLKLCLLVATGLFGTAIGANAQSYEAAPMVSANAKGGSAASIAASMDVAAPPSAVWAALVDCKNAPRFMPKLISCRILKTGPGGTWEIREHRLQGNILKPEMRNVFRVDFQPDRRLSFHSIAGDWKRSDGEWTLTPLAGGKGAHVTYRIEVAVNGPVPASMVRSAVVKGLKESMLSLRREAVARAAK